MLFVSNSAIRRSVVLALMLAIVMPAQLSAQDTARVQFIHASPDPAVEVVDVYLGPSLWLDDFAFATATAYADVPSGAYQLVVQEADGGSELTRQAIVFEDTLTYTVALGGVLSPDALPPNPGGVPTFLRWFVADDALEQPKNGPDTFSIRMLHASPDARPYTFWLDNFGPQGLAIYRNLSYGAFSNVISTKPTTGQILFKGSARSHTDATLTFFHTDVIDFTHNNGRAFVEVVTGFYGAASTDTLPQLTWLWVYPDGSVQQVAFNRPSSLVQVVHAAPERELRAVDVYLDNLLWWKNATFSTGEPFQDLTVGYHTIGIAPKNSRSYHETFAAFNIEVRPEQSYYGILTGLRHPENHPANPDGYATRLDFVMIGDAFSHSTSSSDGVMDFRLFHAVPDAPHVAFIGSSRDGSRVIAASLGYGHASEHDAAPLYGTVQGSFVEAAHHNHRFATGVSDFTGHDDATLLTVATGMVTLQDGVRVLNLRHDGEELAITVNAHAPDAEVPRAFVLHGNYPNPFNPTTSVVFDMPYAAQVTLEVIDILGRVVLTQEANLSAGSNQSIVVDAQALPSGLYLYRVATTVSTGSQTLTGTMVLAK